MAKFDRASLHKGWCKARFFISNILAYIVPGCVYRPYMRLRFLSLTAAQKAEACARVDYYVRLAPGAALGDSPDITTVGAFKFPFGKKKRYSTYFFDLYHTVRLFPKSRRFACFFGDFNHEAPVPGFTKARPIVGEGDHCNSVLMKLNSIRHFILYTDKKPWREKRDIIVFRNVVKAKPHRILYLQRTAGIAMCDSGEVGKDNECPQFVKPYLPVADLLDYKFIATLEGNEVATNLKWVMASNSIAVMPRPKFESWFMEASLVPGYHYIEIADDYSDIEEKLRYYIEHPDEAEAIIGHAHDYVRRFADTNLERYTEYLTAKRYFELTGGCD